MTVERDEYAPGWDVEAVAMMASRVADDRAAFVLPALRDGARVVDVGCGPGSLSVGLARAIAPSGSLTSWDAEPSQVAAAQAAFYEAGIVNARSELASAYSLPVADGSLDVYFSHAMFEHLAQPEQALREARRVLRPEGVLAVVASDWSQARFEPWTGDVAAAMAGHFQLRRRTGGEPFAGRHLSSWVRAAGFENVTEAKRLRIDLDYQQLAEYVHARLAAALRDAPRDDVMHRAVTSASRWSQTPGFVHQCWVEVTATAPT